MFTGKSIKFTDVGNSVFGLWDNVPGIISINVLFLTVLTFSGYQNMGTSNGEIVKIFLHDFGLEELYLRLVLSSSG